MGIYDNVVTVDQQRMRQMSDQTERFKLADGERDIPIIILRQPTEAIFCTPSFRRHWLPEGADEKIVVIPCAESASAPCRLCTMKDALLERGMYDEAPKALKRALDGNLSHDTQVLDLRMHAAILSELRTALRESPQRNSPMATAAGVAALTRLHQAVLGEPVKMWSFSRTVYNLIQTEIYGFMSREGYFRDPTKPDEAAIVWVSKVKTGNKSSATYSLRIDWEMYIPLPQSLFDVTPEGVIGPNTLVKSYDAMHAEAQRSIAYWPEHRIVEVLAERGFNPNMTSDVKRAHGQKCALPQLPLGGMPGAVSVPSPVSIAPAPPMSMPTQPPPQVDVIVSPPPVYASPIKVVAQEAPPQATSAANLACFGKTPSFESDQCKACSRLADCVRTAQDRLMKPMAPAQAELPEPPVATPRKSKMVAAAIQKVTGKE